MYIKTCSQNKDVSLYTALRSMLCAVRKGSLALGDMSYLQEMQLLLWFQLWWQRMKGFPGSGGNHDGEINAASVGFLGGGNGKQLMKYEHNPK